MAIYKLGDLGKFKGGLGRLNKNNYDKGINFINYMDIFKNFKIDDSLILRKYNASEKEMNLFGIEFGNALFTASSEKPSEIAMSSVYLSKEKAIFNGFSKKFEFNHNLLNPFYAVYAFRSQPFRIQATKFATGYTRFNISQKDLSEIKIEIPSMADQQNIIDIIEPLEKMSKIILKINEKLSEFIKLMKVSDNKSLIKDLVAKQKNAKKDLWQISAKVLQPQNTNIVYLEEPLTYKTNSFYAPEETLLFCSIRSYQKKFCITPVEADFNGTLFAYKIKSNATSLLASLFNENLWNICNNLSKGTKMPVLSETDFLNKIQIPLVNYEIENIIKVFSQIGKILLKLKPLQDKVIDLLIN